MQKQIEEDEFFVVVATRLQHNELSQVFLLISSEFVHKFNTQTTNEYLTTLVNVPLLLLNLLKFIFKIYKQTSLCTFLSFPWIIVVLHKVV